MSEREITLSFAMPAKSGNSKILSINYFPFIEFVTKYSDLNNWCKCDCESDKKIRCS